MSTFVEFVVRVEDFKPEREKEILQILEGELFDDFLVDGGVDEEGNKSLEIYSSGSVCGDSTDFGSRLVREVWEANQGYCHVEIFMRFPEYAPVEEIEGDEELYEELTCSELLPKPEGAEPC